jgi:putative DNA primase/helicase
MTGHRFIPPALDYFAAHGITQEIARVLFRPDDSGFAIPYFDGDGSIAFSRRRDLAAGKTLQPAGVSLDLYRPVVSGAVLLACEGESDCGAAITAMFESDEVGADLVRRKNLPPPLADLTPIALPGAGVCHGRLADLVEATGARVFVAFDGDTAGRAGAAKLKLKIPAAVLIDLPDGNDLADVLAGADDPAETLANLVAEAEAGEEVPVEDDDEDDDADALILPSPSAPMDVARKIIDQLDLGERLQHWRGSWWEWKRSHWIEIEDRGVRSTLYRATEHASYVNGEGEMKSWAPNRQKIANLIEALAAIDHLGDHVDQPVWLDGREQVGPIVATANGLLDVDRRELLPHSPQFFNRVSVPFAFEPGPPPPARWLAFLEELWPDDPESISALQEFFGYVLSGRLDQHKILLLVGPTRAGKGVITRILAAMVGPQNVAGPTLSSMGGNFGLAPLLGKPLAIVSDARLSGRNSQVVVERLLAISGEDAITIDRKYRDQWTGKLPCRFVIVSNELPQLGDASAAIANRFVPLVLAKSWLGKEDRRLEDDLRRELPGILSWALDGLERLYGQGRFTSPPSAEEALATLIDLASPVGAFLREVCELSAGAEVDVDDLWSAWKEWCDGAGQPPGSKAMLGRNLRAAQPQVRHSRPLDQDGNKRSVYLGVGLRGAE